MSRLQDLRPIAEAVFRQRLEEVVAVEVVTELGAKKRVSKPKLLLLARPLSGNGGGGSSLNMVAPTKNGTGVKVKETFVVERLREVTHDGSFDATFNFGASGMFSVSFESHIQREMFVAAVRREQDAQRGRSGIGAGAVGGGPGRRVADDLANIRGVLSAAVGAEVEADAATRVRKLRQEKRRVFSTEEEQHLLKFMGRSSFDDVKGFQEVLLGRQKEAELASIDALVRSADGWDRAREQLIGLVQEVEDLETRIEQYSSHLLSKKGVIEQIEHANNALRQKQTNLEELYVMMAELRDQLSLSPQTLALLSRLRGTPNEGLVAFFSEGNNATIMSEAMKHMQRVLRNPQLDTDYPITAVAERKTFFLEQRKVIARRSQSYILSLIAEKEREYLTDKTRYSHEDRLVWRLHSTLSTKLLGIRDIVNALPRIDPEGFTSALRKYRTSMQKVYALEMYRFIKGIKKQVKRVSSWKGPFLLGSSESKEDALTMRMETAQTGETPRAWRGTPAPSPALTPRAMHAYDDDRASLSGGFGGGGGDSSQGGGSRTLSIEFPFSPLFSADVELYRDPNTLRRLDARAASGSVVSSIKSLSSGSSSGGGGHVRPDLAFAIALESAVMVILQEEYMLRHCFGIGEDSAATSDADATGGGSGASAGARNGRWASGASNNSSVMMAGGGDAVAAAAAAAGSGGTGESATYAIKKTAEKQEALALTTESLLELFGGDTLSGLGGGEGGGRGGVGVDGRSSAAAHSRQNSRDLGLPPRPPTSPRGGTGAGLSLSDFYGAGGRRNSYGNAVLSNNSSFGAMSSLDSGAAGPGGENEAYTSLSVEDARRIRRCCLVREMVQLAQYMFDKCDRLYAVPALCMIKAYRYGEKKRLPAQSAFCQGLLRDLETVVAGAMMRFVAEQTESINRCRKRFLVKPTALLHCFAKMPAFILRMEAVHNALAEDVCDRTEYASIATSLVDQSFDVLDYVTNIKASSDGGQGEKMKISDFLAKRVHYALEGLAADTSSLKRGFILQYRHHAFFCAFYAALPGNAYAAELLQDHYESSKLKRDRYEELYLTRVLLVRDFPTFGVFALSAEDLSLVYSQEELRHHRALAADAVRKVVDKLDKELRSGVRSSAARMKKHFLRDLEPGCNEASFHKTLLQRTWQHFGQLLLQKFDFVSQLLKWPMYQGMALPITRQEVTELLAAY